MRLPIYLRLVLCASFSFKIFTLNSQSASVFDANYYKIGDRSPDIQIAKGINIIDVYKPTKQCFVVPPKLKRTETGQKTYIKYYYTNTEEQYTRLKNQGISGQISYLNLFSIGGSDYYNSTLNSTSTVERIVIIAKVDFGRANLATEPILLAEAKALIKKGNYNEFINKYGTHYISGVKKESSIWVTLTKRTNTNSAKFSSGTAFNSEFAPPTYPEFKFETTDKTEVENSIKNLDYNVEVEIHGPAPKFDIKGSITNVMTKPDINHIDEICKVIDQAFKDLSDYNNSLITQYYYTPFDINAIQWDERKLTQLVNINKNVVAVNSSKSRLEKLTNPDGINYISSKFDKDISNFKGREEYKNKYIDTYNTILPNITTYKTELDTALKYLEKVYYKCSNIYCNLDSLCAYTGPYEEKVNQLTTKIKNELGKMSKVKQEAWTMANKSECEKEGVGYVIVVNTSTNPYDFYNGNNYIDRIPGKTTLKYKFKPGIYNLKAQQVSGYVMYPTVNNRQINVTKQCTEGTIKIGFED